MDQVLVQLCIRISIHALREEGDFLKGAYTIASGIFLSTPSARRATCIPQAMSHSRRYFYPRPPRGGRRRRKAFAHTRKEFLSTPSARRATKDGSDPIFIDSISIHALREEGDDGAGCATIVQKYFYPRPPRGGRPEQVPVMQNDKGISIHALREEGDHRQHWPQPWCPYFYPRPPRGGRLSVSANCSLETFISIHALREEGDTSARGSYFFVLHFYPRPPRGGRLGLVNVDAHKVIISIHALREEGDSKNRDKISIFKQIIQHSARI